MLVLTHLNAVRPLKSRAVHDSPVRLIESAPNAADDAVARLSKATGRPERLAGLAVDISNPKSIEAAAQTLERDFAGKLGGLINNAAVCRSPCLCCVLSLLALRLTASFCGSLVPRAVLFPGCRVDPSPSLLRKQACVGTACGIDVTGSCCSVCR